MRFKHLTLQGYKSFATKTEFLFPTGVTAIVGPNGSGKSNVADAIRWVLGEQRIRTLRGKSTADMIFAGGRRRARAGMAQVSITLDNSDDWLPIEFSEVTITRRAYRSGDNEYLINGSKVRLRDISTLLAEGGLSQGTHIVIGQGLVDAALSLRPQERRALFEEAAGISVYRARREETLKRLEDTQRNLERVYDIVGEITPRLRRLAREVARVEEHDRLAAHLKRLQRTWYGYHWGRQQTILGHALEKASALQSSLDDYQKEASSLSARLIQQRQRESELRAKLRNWHRESADLHDRANEAQRELAVTEERTRLLKTRREELLAELEPLNNQQETQNERIAQAHAQVVQLENELAQQQQRLESLEQEWAVVKKQAQEVAQRRAQAEQALRAHRARLEQLNQELVEAHAEAARLASEQAVAEERARQLEVRHEEILTELSPLSDRQKTQAGRVAEARARVEQLEQELSERSQRVMTLEREWEGARQQAQEANPQRTQVEQELQAHRAQLEKLSQELVETRAEAARLAGEQEALDRMHATGAAYDAGVQTLLQADLAGVLGPLAALIQPPPEWEHAIEAALGTDLQAVVVEKTALVEQVRQLLESDGGRLTLLPLDSLRPAPSLPPGAQRAADVVTCNARVRPAVEAMLGAVALCDSLTAARALLPTLPPGSRCATPTGTVLRADGALSVGQISLGGALANERAQRELPAQLEETRRRGQAIERRQQAEADRIAALETQLEGLEQQAAALKEERAQAEREAMEKARTETAVAEETLRNQQAALQRESALLEQIQAQIDGLHQQANELKAERVAIAGITHALHAEAPTNAWIEKTSSTRPGSQVQLEAIQRRCQEIEEQQQAEGSRITALEAELEELTQQAAAASEKAARVERETLGKARTEVAVVEETLRSQQATRQRETALLERLQAQIAARRQRAKELEAENEAIITRTQELRVESSQMETQLCQVRERIQPAEDELTRLNKEQTALEEQEQQARDRMREAESRHGRAQLEVGRRQDELELLSQRIEEDLGLVELELTESVTAQTPLPLRPVVSELPIVEELPDGLKEEIQRLKARLRRLGGVNPNAPVDYAEIQERHQFLTEQSADLETASEQLHQVIVELDELMKTAFKETFDAVAARFSETFTALFNGGAAQLELTEPDDLMNTGVDIVARPPGKRAQRLALLSGGERSLTAVALLFAILHVSPAPFCVLDEVDAMLDEANVGRFRALLEELAQQTQFIVITHNRGTVEAADTVYGISMGTDGVSQMVSLKLD